jgi:hypothetical protein
MADASDQLPVLSVTLIVYPALVDRPWWQPVQALISVGENVTVYDPACRAMEDHWDRDTVHGTVQVLPTTSAGWTVSVHEHEATGFPMEDEVSVELGSVEGEPPVKEGA